MQISLVATKWLRRRMAKVAMVVVGEKMKQVVEEKAKEVVEAKVVKERKMAGEVG